jgi:hypothetical protein
MIRIDGVRLAVQTGRRLAGAFTQFIWVWLTVFPNDEFLIIYSSRCILLASVLRKHLFYKILTVIEALYSSMRQLLSSLLWTMRPVKAEIVGVCRAYVPVTLLPSLAIFRVMS